jgi:hypothetical protein
MKKNENAVKIDLFMQEGVREYSSFTYAITTNIILSFLVGEIWR